MFRTVAFLCNASFKDSFNYCSRVKDPIQSKESNFPTLEAAGMRISTSKSETVVLSRKRVERFLRAGNEILPQVEEFKYLGVLFTSEG